ncbi:hypothetical protein P2Q00_22550 [Streptomyces coacervatus]|uniref:hypothetical protein n=1 Tax=Streptomyces coacervatus TaxID=647381 RepID=UPI0023DB2674|nr:hypothetical protein [Streptomyces coacervatus]MDF2268197.1 hypothetical protein [Streptomyces coacervatus]
MRVEKNPSFFGEYDTSRFFVCWWYSASSPLHCEYGSRGDLPGLPAREWSGS